MKKRRAPAPATGPWEDPALVDPLRLFHEATGDFWSLLSDSDTTLVVARPAENLLVGLGVVDRFPVVSFLRAGAVVALAFDAARCLLHAVSAGTPSRLLDLAPVTSELPRADAPARLRGAPGPRWHAPLLPLRARYYPGCLELVDLALVGGGLHGVASGLNAVVRLADDGRFQPVFWPRVVDGEGGPLFERNHLQLTSLAAGGELATSFVSATTDQVSSRRPGRRGFPVDGRGVLFSAATREPVAHGLTRPHSTRLHGGRLWLANSGYGEVGVFEEGFFRSAARLPGFTRGLTFTERVAFAGTSRLGPRLLPEAPGLQGEPGACGLHALDARTGRLLGSLVWPYGREISAVEALPAAVSSGFPFLAGGTRPAGTVDRLLHGFVCAGRA